MVGTEIDDANEGDKNDADEGYGCTAELLVKRGRSRVRLGVKRHEQVSRSIGRYKEKESLSGACRARISLLCTLNHNHGRRWRVSSLLSSLALLISLLLGFFKGTSADQDRRFSDKELKLLKSIKFPSQFDTKVFPFTFSPIFL